MWLAGRLTRSPVSFTSFTHFLIYFEHVTLLDLSIKNRNEVHRLTEHVTNSPRYGLMILFEVLSINFASSSNPSVKAI